MTEGRIQWSPGKLSGVGKQIRLEVKEGAPNGPALAGELGPPHMEDRA